LTEIHGTLFTPVAAGILTQTKTNKINIAMKTTFKIFMFAVALVLMQACGSKSKENSGETSDAVAAEPTAEEKAATEKQALAEKRKAAQEERTRAAEAKREAAEAYYKNDAGELIYNKAEVAPSFPGGNKGLSKYLSDNLKYPADAQTQGLEGTVYVEFIIGRDGQVRGASISDETAGDADQTLKDEAIRVVDNMPKWTPGSQLGKPVHVKYSLPVTFKLS
jgi:TonB family protein